MLYFTGNKCVNCKKMESRILAKPEVARRLKKDFIVAFFYCDIDKIKLSKNQQYFSNTFNSQVITLGNKYADLQASKFNTNGANLFLCG